MYEIIKIIMVAIKTIQNSVVIVWLKTALWNNAPSEPQVLVLKQESKHNPSLMTLYLR